MLWQLVLLTLSGYTADKSEDLFYGPLKLKVTGLGIRGMKGRHYIKDKVLK